MIEKAENWDVPDSELPSRAAGRTALQEMLAAGYERQACPPPCERCGRQVIRLASPAGTLVECNVDGTLHADCRSEREPALEPLPPVPTFADQQATLDRLLGKK